MKKFLLALISLVMIPAVSSAKFDKADVVKAPVNASAPQTKMKAPTANGYDIRFCQDLYSWYTFSNTAGLSYRCYIHVPASIATALAGNQVTAVSYTAYIKGSTASGHVFVSEGAPSSEVATQAVATAMAQNPIDVAFDKPYTIKAGQDFYFGMMVENVGASDYPVPVDDNDITGPFSGEVELSLGAQTQTVDMASEIGYNLFLYAVTVGDKKKIENIFSLSEPVVNMQTLPVLNDGEKAVVYLTIDNIGDNDITSIGYSYAINGGAPKTGEASVNIPAQNDPNENGTIGIAIPDALPAGHGSISFDVTSVNGVAVDEKSSAPFIMLPAGAGYDRKFVVEEGTGTWCGWCPRGIVGMEYMTATYPERFIGIAVHYNDNMASASYQPLIQEYFSGFPTCIVNRDPIFIADPSQNVLDMIYTYYWKDIAAPANIALTVNPDDAGNLLVTADTQFAIDNASAAYSLAFVIIEDGLTNVQTNNYAGGSYGEMGGWEAKRSSAIWTYTDTAINIFDVFGIEGSVPASVKAGTSYRFQDYVPLTSVKKVENTSVIALLLDNQTGVVLNAAKVAAANYGEVLGVEDIQMSANDAVAEYFNLQGVRIANPEAGNIYIVRRGADVKKVLVK